MKMSENGRRLLAKWEGFKLHVYNDSANKPTIGVGHLLTRDELTSAKIYINGEPVRYAGGLTEGQVLDLLAQDLERFENTVNNRVTVDLQQNQFDALVAFSFNVGTEAFKTSTLLKVLNEGQYDEVPNQLMQWTRTGGKVVQGLINRREKEIKLWNGEI